MGESIGWIIFLIAAFGGGFAVGYGVRQKEEVRENARRFKKMRDANALSTLRERFGEDLT